MKNANDDYFRYWLVLMGRSSRSKNNCSISYSFYVVLWPRAQGPEGPRSQACPKVQGRKEKNGNPRFSVKIKKVDFSDNIYHTGWSNFVPVSKIKRNHNRWCDIKQMIAQPRMRNRWKTPAHGSSVQEPREIIRNFSSKVWGCNNRFHSLYKFILHLRFFSNLTEARVDRIES